MANEVNLTAALEYSDANGVIDTIQVPSLSVTIATLQHARITQSIGFAASQAIVLGGATAGGWIMMINRDPTNFINILTGTGGVIFAKLLPGEFCLFRMGSGVTAPFAQASTATCILDVLVVSL